MAGTGLGLLDDGFGAINHPTGTIPLARRANRVFPTELFQTRLARIMIDWNIQSRAHRCQSCNADFTAKQAFHTLLYDQRHGYERMDICGTCWTEQYSQGGAEKKGFVSHWQGSYTPPPSAPPDAIQKDTAESLLRKLVERNQPEFAAVRFILAVMLERKRLLKVKTQIVTDGRRVLIYEHPKSGDLISIADPDLQLNQLEQVQRDVGHLLEHGLPGEVAPDGVSPAPEQADTAAPPATDSTEDPALVEPPPSEQSQPPM